MLAIARVPLRRGGAALAHPRIFHVTLDATRIGDHVGDLHRSRCARSSRSPNRFTEVEIMGTVNSHCRGLLPQWQVSQRCQFQRNTFHRWFADTRALIPTAIDTILGSHPRRSPHAYRQDLHDAAGVRLPAEFASTPTRCTSAETGDVVLCAAPTGEILLAADGGVPDFGRAQRCPARARARRCLFTDEKKA